MCPVLFDLLLFGLPCLRARTPGASVFNFIPNPGSLHVMKHQCSVMGCTASVVALYSPYCPRHRHQLGRHGHPMQTAIRPRELAPFIRLIVKRQADNADSAAWTILRARWSALVEDALAVMARVVAGQAFLKVDAEVARLIQGVAGVANADQVLRACMAVVMHSRADPRSYRDDRAVVFQMARAFLRLNPGSMGRYYCSKANASRTVRRDVRPRVLEELGKRLNQAFGGAAAQLHHIEVNRRPPAVVEAEKLAKALEGLKA